MARPLNANAKRTRQKLIHAATTLFADQGRAGASVRDIARSASVNVAMISHYFGSKQGLYDACIDAMYTDLGKGREDMAAAILSGGSVRDIVQHAARESFVFARNNREALRLILRHVLDHGELDPERREEALLPFLSQFVVLLTPHSKLDGQSIRLGLQSLLFLSTRYALSSTEELMLVSGCNSNPEGRIGDHLAMTAIQVLGL